MTQFLPSFVSVRNQNYPFPKSFITDWSNITHFWEIFLNVLYFGSSQFPIRHFLKIGNLDQLIDRIE